MSPILLEYAKRSFEYCGGIEGSSCFVPVAAQRTQRDTFKKKEKKKSLLYPRIHTDFHGFK